MKFFTATLFAVTLLAGKSFAQFLSGDAVDPTKAQDPVIEEYVLVDFTPPPVAADSFSGGGLRGLAAIPDKTTLTTTPTVPDKFATKPTNRPMGMGGRYLTGGFVTKPTKRPAKGASGGGRRLQNRPSGPGDLKGGAGCSIQCIIFGKAYARGVNSLLVVKTDYPATIQLTIFGPTGNVMASSGAGEMEYSHYFGGLQAGTTYSVLAQATDSDGQTSQVWGEFTTLVRNIQVTMENALFFKQATANPEYHKAIYYNGAWVPVLAEGHLNPVPSLSGMEQIFFVHDSFQDGDVDQMMSLAVQLREKNLDGEVCEVALWPTEPAVGTNHGSCSYDSFVSREFDLDSFPPDATSYVEHTLVEQMNLPCCYVNVPFRFFVPTVINVKYEPL